MRFTLRTNASVLFGILSLGLWFSGVAARAQSHEGEIIQRDGSRLVMSNGAPVLLTPCRNGRKPSLAELTDFLRTDDTSQHLYVPGQYVCTEFAVHLQQAASAAGLKCGLLTLDFQDGPGHALCLFETTDAGYVFVDCTGRSDARQDARNYATFGFVRKGQPYGRLPLEVARSGPLSYEHFQAVMLARRGTESAKAALTQEAVEIKEEGNRLNLRLQHLDRTSAPAVKDYNAAAKVHQKRVDEYNLRVARLNRIINATIPTYDTGDSPVTNIEMFWR